MMRIGHGYDVHKLVEGRELILGGVHIPHSLGLLGHSDADVLLHAISDAILGAALTGLVCALAIGFAFSVAEMIPADLPGKAAVEESATGRSVRPLARKMAGFKAPAPTTAESAR